MMSRRLNSARDRDRTNVAPELDVELLLCASSRGMSSETLLLLVSAASTVSAPGPIPDKSYDRIATGLCRFIIAL